MNRPAVPHRLIDRPHHDGSPAYTDPGPHRLGSIVEVRVRVPHACRADRVRVRSAPDAEQLITEARVDRTTDRATWWTAALPLRNPVTNYRFLLEGGTVGYGWVNEAGLTLRDVSDHLDFRITTHGSGPAWLASTVGYEIFIDRFARSNEQPDLPDVPDWAVGATWDTPVATDGRTGARQFYGGDLAGIERHLDHLGRLGVNLVYLTPFFPARSAHRYDAASFGTVDPLLGGDDALVSLTRAAHARGIRVIGDITLNHTGDHHLWFETARSERDAVERGFYMFDGADDYVSWHDVPSLPKLDHRSDELARRLYRGAGSVVARYVDAPFELDGWRVDCANTTGRHADVDLTAVVARDTRSTLDAVSTANGGDRWLVAEHCYDATADLRGDGWHGVMAYQWFTRPLWSWLRGDRPVSLMSQLDVPRLGGDAVVAAMRELGGSVPWTARTASMTMLDSHDTARFRTAVGADRDRHVVGLAALLTFPGVPTLFAGSEVGVEGDSMDTCRSPFPWPTEDRHGRAEDRWDHDLLDATTALIAVRTASRALQRGGLRWLDATTDTITFARELPDETVVVHLRRAAGDAVRFELADVLDDPGRTRPDVHELFGHGVSVVAGAAAIEFSGTVGASIVVC